MVYEGFCPMGFGGGYGGLGWFGGMTMMFVAIVGAVFLGMWLAKKARVI